jgi:hypothetical protein
MNEPTRKVNTGMVVQLSIEELRAIIRDEVRDAIKSAGHDDQLLTADEVAATLKCTADWVYHNSRNLPFVGKVGGMLRFSANGLQRYIDARRFTVS